MNVQITDIYKGWTISIMAVDNKCSHFSFEITNRSIGYNQHVSMGGITQQRAIERAKEMIDMEIALYE